MNRHQITRVLIESRRWATRLVLVALLILLSGGSCGANAVMVLPGIGGDEPQGAVQLTSTRFLPGFLMDIQGPLPAGAIDLHSRAPIMPVSPSPSSGLLFVTALLGLLGMAVHREPCVRKALYRQKPRSHWPRSTGSVIILSHDEAFVKDIEAPMRRGGYDVRVATAVSEIVALPIPTAPALVLVDHRMQDWDMLRTDPLLRHIQLMAVVPADSTYTEEHCRADLERGLDGVHDMRDGYGLLAARVGAYLRRAGGSRLHRGIYQAGAVEFDSDSHEVSIAGTPVHLSAKPLAILNALIREPAKLFTRSELIRLLWGQNFAIGGHALDVHLHALRRQLARDPNRLCRIITVKGVGFKLKPPPSTDCVAQEIYSEGQDRSPTRSHHRRRPRYLHPYERGNGSTNPDRQRVATIGGVSPTRRS